MEQADLCGTGVALVSPFYEDGSIDFLSLEKIVEYVINGGVDYIVVMGTTGESATINKNEKKLIVDKIVEINNGRLPLVYGIGGNNTMAVVDTIKSTDLSPFSAILSVSPYYNKPGQEGIYRHFKYISENCDKPIILYNVPGRTAQSISASTTLKLARECENIVAIKEASGDLVQISEIIKYKPDDFMVISGDDALTFPMMALGGCGVISVVANVLPTIFSKMVRFANEQNFSEAKNIHLKLIDFIGLLFQEGSPAGIKAAMHIKGLLKNEVRLPLVSTSESLYHKIASELKKMEA